MKKIFVRMNSLPDRKCVLWFIGHTAVLQFAVVAEGGATVRVVERGSGETMACGTGACATVVAAVENGISPKNEFITVSLLGGDLKIKYQLNGEVLMDGGAEFAFEGEIND